MREPPTAPPQGLAEAPPAPGAAAAARPPEHASLGNDPLNVDDGEAGGRAAAAFRAHCPADRAHPAGAAAATVGLAV